MCKKCEPFPEHLRIIAREIAEIVPGYVSNCGYFGMDFIYYGYFSINVDDRPGFFVRLNYYITIYQLYQKQAIFDLNDPDSLDKITKLVKECLKDQSGKDINHVMSVSKEYDSIKELPCW